MFEEYQICPYTGLRSFTEEESLYFKGREEHIEHATQQLQINKFLMLTGASGDGKSSLVYAGIIPNARAGFLKSKYTQWCVADFRPERTPFHNLCRAIAKQLEIDNATIVESELRHGFSALADLYRNSKRHIDVHSVAWENADDTGKAAMKREAANLIILVDQFEEFFTNPENYLRGVPSVDSNLVLNLLLETSRIALEEDLPIYVVFTMRSDFIGQCAAFRGLPEYIGFSQFFVPRLNRQQLQQVIEEPAELSGNRITRRLTERLIHDLTEGTDQLPILQHALNQIWLAANDGAEEMDLIHYAMVGGMPSIELPDDQVSRFNQWFESLSPVIKACYHKPDLQNVLDTHTNKLYEQAAEYYKGKTGKDIVARDAKELIKGVFTCLTKIDQSRAVRNRMTLKEISSIIGHSEFGAKEIGALLNTFREPGNTFVRPFITDDTDSLVLKENDVLDITHESLIRNWAYLGKWAEEEYQNYATSLDFEQQLQRWVESGKSNDFLLSIGALTYFEGWYLRARPNASWIARYLPDDFDTNKKLARARGVLANAQELIRRSARKHIVTRTVMRYGGRRIAAVFALIAFFTFSSFGVNNFLKRQNEYVLDQLMNDTYAVAASPKTEHREKGLLMAEQIRSGRSWIDDLLEHISDTLMKVDAAASVAGVLTMQGQREPATQIQGSFEVAIRLMEKYNYPGKSAIELENFARRIGHLRSIGIAVFCNPTEDLRKLKKANGQVAARFVKYILTEQPAGFHAIRDFSIALETAVNESAFSAEDLDWLSSVLSPFDESARSAWIKDRFHRDKVQIRSRNSYGFQYNGLYLEMAQVFAARGDLASTLRCTDSLIHQSKNYYVQDLSHMMDNASVIAGTLLLSGHDSLIPDFVAGYSSLKGTTVPDAYDRLISRSTPSFYVALNFDNTNFGGMIYTNLHIQLLDDDQLDKLFSYYHEAIDRYATDPDDRNFRQAVAYKIEGLYHGRIAELRDKPLTGPEGAGYYDKALDYYRKTNSSHREEVIYFAESTDPQALRKPRKYQFLYPDYWWTFWPVEPRFFTSFYTGVSFPRYLVDNGLIPELYSTSEDLKYWEEWFSDLDFGDPYLSSYGLTHRLDDWQFLLSLDQQLSTHKAYGSIDVNSLLIAVGKAAYMQGQGEASATAFARINSSALNNMLGSRNRRNFVFTKLGLAVSSLYQFGKKEKALDLIEHFSNPTNQSSLYAYASSELGKLGNDNQETAGILLDSAKAKIPQIKNLTSGQPNREILAEALMVQNPDRNEDEAYRMLKNSFIKFRTIQKICGAYAMHGQLYQARQHITPNVSESDRALFLWNIMRGYSMREESTDSLWNHYETGFAFPELTFIRYVSDDN